MLIMANPKKTANPTYLREIEIRFKKKRMSSKLSVGKPIVDAKQVYNLFRDLENEQKEKMITLHLDLKNKIICFEVVALGSLDAIYVRPMEILRSSFAVNAHAAVIIHNHPSGDPSPSENDKKVTKKLLQMSKDMGLLFIDHIIIGEDGYYSFSEKGLL